MQNDDIQILLFLKKDDRAGAWREILKVYVRKEDEDRLDRGRYSKLGGSIKFFKLRG